jgi:hypothetical protein
VCGAKLYRYAAPAVFPVATATAGAATGWVWSFTGSLGANASIDSGDVNTRVIVVRYTSNSAAVTGDSVRVLYTSDCGNSANKASKLTNVATLVPLAPTAITITAIQTNVCGVRKYRYAAPAVVPVASATLAAPTGWLWSFTGTLGANATIDSGDVNSKVITVTYTINTAASAGDSVRVQYLSSCGSSAIKSAKLNNTIISAPTAPSAISITLVSDICGARVYRYAAPALPVATATTMAATGYIWSLPLGSSVATSATLDSGDMSGENARYIKLVFSSNAAAIAGDSIRVKYMSDCGTSFAKAQKLSNIAISTLAAPAALTGVTSICNLIANKLPTTYTSGAVAGAVSYLWTLPAGAYVDSGSNGLKIKLHYVFATANDSIYVQAIGANGCISAKKVLKLTTTGCASPSYTKVETSAIKTTVLDPMSVSIYPNPTTTAYQLYVKSSKVSNVTARVLDVQGRLVNTFKFSSMETIAFGSELKPGVYMVEVREGKEVKTVRVVKY